MITIHPKSKTQTKIFEDLAKVLDIPFERVKPGTKYRAEFISKIKKGDYQKKSGNYKTIKTSDLWK